MIETAVETQIPQVGMNPRAAIGLVTRLMADPDVGYETTVEDSPHAVGTFPPGVIPAPRLSGDLTHQFHRVLVTALFNQSVLGWAS